MLAKSFAAAGWQLACSQETDSTETAAVADGLFDIPSAVDFGPDSNSPAGTATNLPPVAMDAFDGVDFPAARISPPAASFLLIPHASTVLKCRTTSGDSVPVDTFLVNNL